MGYYRPCQGFRHCLTLAILCNFLPISQAMQWHISESISGISGLPYDNAMLRLRNIKRELGTNPSANDLTAFYHQAPQAIASALKPYGYFKPEITKKLTQQGSIISATYHINPGPQAKVRIASLSINGPGSNQTYFQELQQQFPIKPNDGLNTSLYDKTKESLITTAINHGYLRARFTETTLEINTRANTAIIRLAFNTGEQFAFGNIHFSPTPLSTMFLRRYLPFKTGDPFNNTLLSKLQDQLGNSQYFDQVIVSPQVSDQEDSRHVVPIDIQLNPRKKRNYKLSLGYGSNNGIRSSAQLNLPFINSQGHRATTSLTLAKKFAFSDLNHDKVTVDTDYPTEATLQLQYFIPGKNPSKEMFSVETTIKRTSFYTEAGRKPFTNREITGQYLNNIHRWKQIASVTYLHESSETAKARPIQFDLFSPAIRWTKISSDSLLTPNHGTMVNISLRGADNLANSDYNFVIIKAKGRHLMTFAQYSRLLTHLELGYMSSEDQEHVPKTYQLLSGGSTSLRGFDYLAIGPGTHMGILGTEFQRIITNSWVAGIFIEGGNVYSSFEAIGSPTNNNDKTKVSQGFSLTKQTPIGSLSLSYARAKRYRPEFSRWKWQWKWHFSIGTEL